MVPIKRYIIIVIFFIVAQFYNCAFCIDDTNNGAQDDVINLNSEYSEKLVSKIDFDEIVEKAKEHSYDLKVADFNILISKQDIKGARSEYFPKLFASAGTEYTRNFRDIKETSVVSIGESFINPYTRFQSIMGITLNYNLFDFGVRKNKLDIAKEDNLLQELKREEQLQELNLNLLDTYSKILMLLYQIDYKKEIYELQKKNLEFKTRLYNAHELAKTDLSDAKVKVENSEKQIYEIQSILKEQLNWLEFYTGEKYDAYNLKANDIKISNSNETKHNDYTKSITWRLKEVELKKKELEINIAKHENYPKVNTYARYYLYGSDHNNYAESFGNIRPSNFTVGGSVSMLAFDGLKNRANIEKVTLEYKQLEVERDKAIAQLMTRLATMRSNLILVDKQIENNNKIVKELNDKQKSIKRLVAKRISTPIEENDSAIELLEQKIELIKNNITSIATSKGIEILTTY